MLVIGLCIGFLIGNIVGVVLMALMVAASKEDKRREDSDLREELDKMYRFYNDHMLAISPDERTPDSEYEFRKGISVGIQQCLNSLAVILKGEYL